MLLALTGRYLAFTPHSNEGVFVVIFEMYKVFSCITRIPKAVFWAVKRRIKPPILPVNKDGGIFEGL